MEVLNLGKTDLKDFNSDTTQRTVGGATDNEIPADIIKVEVLQLNYNYNNYYYK